MTKAPGSWPEGIYYLIKETNILQVVIIDKGTWIY